MLRTLRSTTFLAPVSLAFLPSGAIAQLTIDSHTTTPVRTSTAGSGGPAAIVVTEDGAIDLDGGTAITMDSDNDVSNAGELILGGSDGAIGIDVVGQRTGTITNSGSIIVREDFVADNADDNTIVDGPIARHSDRFGIHVGDAFWGDVVNSGSISIEGLGSAGIQLDGQLNGGLSSTGAITIIGDDSVGIRTGDVTGNVSVNGAVSVIGEGARAVDITGNIGGTLNLQNTIAQQVSYVDDDGSTMYLSRSDLRVNAPAVSVAGNVDGGIIVAVQPTIDSSNSDADGDGIADEDEGDGAIQSYGNGAALQIGGAQDTTIGVYSGRDHSLVIDGTVKGNAYYSNTDAYALVIGGQGGNVSMPGGISVTGTVQATTDDSAATAILINSGSTVPVIDNSGSIIASITSSGEGATYAIRDLSGSLTTINNSGTITANGSNEDEVAAIDLSANTSGVTINQQVPDGSSVTPVITGPILTGSGNDVLNVSAGTVTGNSILGAGDDSVHLSGDAAYSGKIDFGTGTAAMTLADTATFSGTAAFNDEAATLTIGDSAVFSGAVAGGANLAVRVDSGTLEASGTSDLDFASLTVGSGGTLKVAIDGDSGTNPKFNVGVATFEDGAHIAATVSSLAAAEGRYVVLTADTITGTPTFSDDDTLLPYLFKGDVTVDQTAGEVVLDLSRKTATELGLNRNQAAAYAAILAAAPGDGNVEKDLLGVTDGDTLSTRFNSLLPDYAGGNFDLLTRGSRLATRHLTNSNTMFDISHVGGWFEALKWGGGKDETESAGFTTSGWGFSGGLERVTGIGNVGLSFSWMNGSNKNDALGNEVKANAYEFGAFWRIRKGPFYAFARAAYTLASFDGTRNYNGVADDTAFVNTATADWDGQMYSGTAGVSYMADVSDRISFKPMAIIDYYHLHEDGYDETGGGDAMNLSVAGRSSDALFATTTVTAIYRFGPRSNEGIPLTIELEGGRRNRLGGTLGDTVARFSDGDDFTLTPDAVKGGWVGELRLLSGGLDYTWTISGNVEQTQGDPAYGARISLGVAF